MTTGEHGVVALTVETTRCDDLSPLVPMLDAASALLWTRRGFGVVGIGEALRMTFSGPTRVADAADAWQRVAAAATVRDPLGRAGTGLIALGSFAFAEWSELESVLIVPALVVGRDGDGAWISRIRTTGTAESALEPPIARPFADNAAVGFEPGSMSADGYREAVASATEAISRHRVSKVVLARDATAQLPASFDLRRVLCDLALGYPDCWTFAVDGFIGSSPETLVSVSRGTVTARVLAGSAARGTDAATDQDAATALATSAKDLDEHRFAVESALRSLRPHSADVVASELPFTLKLPNLWHLASDVEGELSDGSTALDLVGAMHPTAAVAGTPTDAALDLIRELEPFDRGRYAGPVGWVGADGDGEWAIGLRSAQVRGDRVTAYAGAGIVAESVPERELVETRMKFRPIVDAFG